MVQEETVQRHITVSSQEGLVTELEVTGAGQSEQYILRHHKAAKAAGTTFSVGVPTAVSWIGFRYRDTQWSIVTRGNSRNDS